MKEKESFSSEEDFAIDPAVRWFHFDKQLDPSPIMINAHIVHLISIQPHLISMIRKRSIRLLHLVNCIRHIVVGRRKLRNNTKEGAEKEGCCCHGIELPRDERTDVANT